MVKIINDIENFMEDSRCTRILSFINKHPDLYTIMQVFGGQGGNVIYRAMCATDDTFFWDEENFPRTWEDADNRKPLDWPRKTEGYEIYDTENIKVTNKSFRENHATTAHVDLSCIENMKSIEEFKKYSALALKNSKKLLIRTHIVHLYAKAPEVDIINVYGNLDHLLVSNKQYNHRGTQKSFIPDGRWPSDHVYNFDISNFLSYDYDKFEKEYLGLCKHLNVMANISNVRAYVLLWLERLYRFNNNLP